jgi:hypothetical protein
MSEFSVVMSLLQGFFSKSATVEEVLTIVPQLLNALEGERAGTGFSISIPIGTQTFKISATPNTASTVSSAAAHS